MRMYGLSESVTHSHIILNGTPLHHVIPNETSAYPMSLRTVRSDPYVILNETKWSEESNVPVPQWGRRFFAALRMTHRAAQEL